MRMATSISPRSRYLPRAAPPELLLGDRIYKLDVNNVATVVAGYGYIGSQSLSASGDGGFAIDAGLNIPQQLALDNNNNLYIADSGNNKFGKVNLVTGIISTVAGNGNPCPGRELRRRQFGGGSPIKQPDLSGRGQIRKHIYCGPERQQNSNGQCPGQHFYVRGDGIGHLRR